MWSGYYHEPNQLYNIQTYRNQSSSLLVLPPLPRPRPATLLAVSILLFVSVLVFIAIFVFVAILFLLFFPVCKGKVQCENVDVSVLPLYSPKCNRGA